jgi:hypothetical protein
LQQGCNLWQGSVQSIWREARLRWVMIDVHLEQRTSHNARLTTKLNDPLKELHAVHRTDAIGYCECTAQFVALQWPNQIPLDGSTWAKLCDRGALLFKFLDAILTEGPLTCVNRFDNSLRAYPLGDSEKFNAAFGTCPTQLRGADTGAKDRQLFCKVRHSAC